jgi:hypothetical protein
MWVKLSTEYLNLDQVFRIRLNKGFRNGSEELVAEVEIVDPKGQIGTVTRFRGADAELLQTVLNEQSRTEGGVTEGGVAVATAEPAPVQAMTGTVADMQLP